jgi:hypothetical protein
MPPDDRRRRSEAWLAPVVAQLGEGAIPDERSIADTALQLRPTREIAARALCHAWVAQFATDCGAGFEGAFAQQIQELGLEPSLTDEERALLRKEAVTDEGLRLGYEEEAALALAWLLGLADSLPIFDGDSNAFMRDEDAIRMTLLDPAVSLDGLCEAARLRAVSDVADEIDRLARYASIYARERPGWRFGGAGEWIGSLGPEAVSARLRALRWAARVRAPDM